MSIKKKYKYGISVSRWGGEHVVGKLTNKVGKYWSKHEDKLEDHVCDGVSKGVPKEYRLPMWYELDDITHVNGIEWTGMSKVEVRELSNNKVIDEFQFDDIPVERTIIKIDDNDPFKKDGVKKGYYFYGQLFGKGYWSGEIVTNQPYNRDMMRFYPVHWYNYQGFLEQITYQDQKIELESDPNWKSQSFFIFNSENLRM